MGCAEEAGIPTFRNVMESPQFSPFNVYTSYAADNAADKACVCTSEASNLFDCSIRVKQGCPLSPLLFTLYLDGLESQLEEASDKIDCPHLAEILITVLLFADDIAQVSYSQKGGQR